jgi:hypothetical protein
MKTKLLLTAIAVCLSYVGMAQTKGTNALGFGINTNTTTNTISGAEGKTNQNTLSLGYGYFIDDNKKIGIDLSYLSSKQNSLTSASEINGYGINASYQKYYPIVKTLFAFAGGNAGYFYSKQSNYQPFDGTNYVGNSYSIGAYGGITWFFSKRFALETSLLSANMDYSNTKINTYLSGTVSETESTSFNLNTSGVFHDLGFKIYLLF